jgi:DNA helicase-2/ATP-dependent DNA helicase PcrA
VEAARDAEQLDALSARAQKAVAGFWRLYRELHDLQTEGIADLLRKVVERTSYVDRQPLDEKADVQEVVDMFIGYAAQYDQRSPDGGLMGFLEQAALVSDVDGWNARASAVPFMTLHSAKGLEFDAVFLVGLEEDMLPHRRAIEDHAQGTEEGAIEEERRLFYVGMTRARHRLFISHANRRVLRGREEPTIPSRFLDELPEDCIERDESRKTVRTPAGSFAKEMDSVLKKKLGALEVLDGAGLKAGARVRHAQFGTGIILETSEIGARHMIRVNFFDHGTMALILGAGDVQAD